MLLNLCNFPSISNVNSRKFICALSQGTDSFPKTNRNRSSQNVSTPICRRTLAFRVNNSLRRVWTAAATGSVRSERSSRPHQGRRDESLAGDADFELFGGRNRTASDGVSERQTGQRMDA